MYFLYFDPGIGAMIIQGIIAAVAGIVLFSKNLMYKIKLFFGMVKIDDENLFDDIEVSEPKEESKKDIE